MSDSARVQAACKILFDPSRKLIERYHALFTLKIIGGKETIKYVSKCFNDPSALLKHELAYCLGQMQDPDALPILISVLKDTNQETMVRHEAGEALGAIGSQDALDVLRQYANDPLPEIAETCQLALQRIEWLQTQKDDEKDHLSENPYNSVDPAPPSIITDVKQLKETLLNESLPLFDRYRAMFSLRNKGGEDAVLALAEGLKCSSALFRHEIAYVLGQMQDDGAAKQLSVNLADANENPMVRHECAEALGSIAKDSCLDILKNYKDDKERVVKESCEVALDMSEYERGPEFQYADTLAKLKSATA
ncbi:deoxyhypusine hydroxylase isoform X2 [Nematostella vectensis]|uniref:deoxyhypusine hydroxylase isoform X2 n=1 Tax=Nematostella vectensis TaxID=45351 RepID=UPI002077808F|nr:deoxyhypusine hydroxylase isoform X2 [Nematostella vectensis]